MGSKLSGNRFFQRGHDGFYLMPFFIKPTIESKNTHGSARPAVICWIASISQKIHVPRSLNIDFKTDSRDIAPSSG
jgi:hypothetical protein